MTTHDERRSYHRLLADAAAGRLTRREVLGRGAALGLAAPFLTSLATATPGVATAAQDATPTTGGILKVGLQADPTALDPHKQSLTAIWHVVEHIYDRLVRVQPDLSVEPELAESWEISPDGLVYTFRLRSGVAFSDGTPLLASDVKFSFDRLKAPETASPSASDLAAVASVDAPDEATVVLNLTAPDASLLAILSNQSCVVMSEAFVTANNNDVSQKALGTGPFTFREYVPNTRVVLDKNPTYWETGLPYVDGLELTIASDDTSRTTAVVTGTVDFIEYAPLRDIEILEQDANLTLAGDSNTNIRFVAFNTTREPFNNPLVRQAIAAVIDREAMLGPAVFGRGTPTEVLFPPDYWAALPQEVRPADVARAQELLTEAGFPDGFTTSITSWSQYSFLSAAAVVLQEQLKLIGIEAELNLVENATMLEQVNQTKQYDIAVTGTSAYVDPNSVIFGNFKSTEASNFTGYNNPEVDALIDQGIAVTDQAQRAEIYQEIQRLLLQDLPWVSLFVANQYEAMRSDVKGYEHIPTGSNHALRRTWLDR